MKKTFIGTVGYHNLLYHYQASLPPKIKSKFVKIIHMKAEQLREKLHQYIDKLDETRLDEVCKIIEDEDIAWQYSSEDIKMLYERRSSYLNGEVKNYTLEESINSIRK